MLNSLRHRVWGAAFGLVPPKQQEQGEVSGSHQAETWSWACGMAGHTLLQLSLLWTRAGLEKKLSGVHFIECAVNKLHACSLLVLCSRWLVFVLVCGVLLVFCFGFFFFFGGGWSVYLVSL